MKKVIILQNYVPHYRKPVYNNLSLKYDVTILHSGNPSITENDSFKEIIVKSHKIWKFHLQSGVIKTLRANKYDTVIAMFDLAWISYMLINFIFPNRIIYWGNRYSSNFFINLFRTLIMRTSKSNILYSEIEIERMIASGIDEKKIFIAHNTILIPNKENCSNILKDRFLFVGRAQKRKKVDLLIKAFKLYIIGEGEENHNLKKYVNKLSLNDRIIFTGKIHDDTELKKHFSKSYAYISPGPVGLGVLHSFSYGVPVVTLDYGKHGPEFSNIIDQENGLLFNNLNELESIMINLVKNKKNTKRLASNAFSHYNTKRNINVMVDGIIEAINYDV
jgi:glycosyltransferase involved in cell wall biosynthesis